MVKIVKGLLILQITNIVHLAPQVFEYILSNSSMFPGKHNLTQERTSDGLTVLDPVRYICFLFLVVLSFN